MVVRTICTHGEDKSPVPHIGVTSSIQKVCLNIYNMALIALENLELTFKKTLSSRIYWHAWVTT